MMANFSVSMSNAAFELSVQRIKAQAINDVKTITKATAERIVSESKIVVPVDTGRLRDSIRYVMILDDMGAEISANTEYAAFVEFGTSRQRAQPYLIPSLEKEKAFYIDELTKALKNLG